MHWKSLLAWVIVPVVLGLGSFLPFVRGLDLRSLDAFLPGHPPHADIVILAIDNQSITDLGRWPWSRQTFARLLNTLAPLSPRAIGIDVTFSEPSNASDDAAFSTALTNIKVPVVQPVQGVQHTDGSVTPLLPLEVLRSPKNVILGHAQATASEDGLARPLPLSLIIGDATYQPFALALAHSLGFSGSIEPDRTIAFAGGPGTYQTFSISDVIAGKVDPSALQEKIVLIGATASDLHDTVQTPTGFMAGIEWHANVLDTLLTNRSRALAPPWFVAMLSIFSAVVALWFLHERPVRTALIATAATVIVFMLLSTILAWNGFLVPFLSPGITIAGTVGGSGLWRLLKTDREKRRLRRTLQNYFSPRVMDVIVNSPNADVLGAKRAEISVLFSDIRNFTTISEQSDPEMLCGLLQEYFTAMSEVIHASDGVLEKFIGDAVVSFWGAPLPQPDHAERAVRTALAMYARFLEVRSSWEERGIHGVDMGIAVNTGPALVGNMGSKTRFNFGMLGDTVNTTSRLEGLNKEFKTHIIVSAKTASMLPPTIPTRSLGEAMVKGKAKPVAVFEVPLP